jgi:hypothetical protein
LGRPVLTGFKGLCGKELPVGSIRLRGSFTVNRW